MRQSLPTARTSLISRAIRSRMGGCEARIATWDAARLDAEAQTYKLAIEASQVKAREMLREKLKALPEDQLFTLNEALTLLTELLVAPRRRRDRPPSAPL